MKNQKKTTKKTYFFLQIYEIYCVISKFDIIKKLKKMENEMIFNTIASIPEHYYIYFQ